MKKSVFTLLALIATIYPVRAYEYFTIFFSDGTKSETFYATDVDSICYSKLSLDSIAYDEWQVQEIYTCDSVYRYPLAQIDSLSFKEVDVNQVAENLDRANSAVVPLFSQCKSVSELSQNLSTIRNIEGVRDAWIDGNALSIDICDYGTITFINPPAIRYSHDMNYALALNRSMSLTTSQTSSNIGKVCIYNHMDKDEDEGFNDSRWVTKNLKEMYDCLGISCEVKTHLLPDFFVNQMFDYDQLFIITHGYYDKETGTHWLVTDEEILCIDNDQWFSHVDEFKDFLNKKAIYSSNKIKILTHPEIRNGKSCVVFYVAVSEHLISMSKHRFQNPNAIIFNAACQSMKGEDSNKNNLAKAFINKGASCYIGYTDNNTRGRLGGFEFYQGILNGSCVESSYNLIEKFFKEEDLYEYKSVSTGQASLFRTEQNEYLYELENEYHPIMKIIRSNPQYSALHVETMDVESNSSTNGVIVIHGQMRKINSDAIQAFTDYALRPLKDKYQYGFQLSKNSDMSQPDSAKVEGNYDPTTLYMNWKATLSENDLEPNTTYYYRAYMNDGYSNCYGEVVSFTTECKPEAYAVLSEHGTILTYYYDEKKSERRGINIPDNTSDFSFDDRERIETVSFDSSFVNYKPISTQYWFVNMSNLTSIQNIKNLNTSNVTTMLYMFGGCGSLTSLDVSNFNTANVTNMVEMFAGCSSLTTLDVSNFNTANVTDMRGMFGSCSSLTTLDVSNFNTANVTNMSYMFDGCGSLTSLDVSNFNTANVMNMSYMFSSCISLTSLDLSNFNTVNVSNMGDMFDFCISLTTLDLSSFITANVTNMGEMFSRCRSLTTLDLSSLNTANITNMRNMFCECSSLTTLDVSSFNTANVTDMASMFGGCSSLTTLDVSNFNTANVTDMRGMFAGCSSLTTLDVGNFNTANVTNMRGMFGGCSSLTTLDLSSLNTANVTDMASMFNGCSSLTTLDVGNFNTANVTNMGSMFNGCNSLTTLDVGNFNTANVTNMGGMFSSCISLTSLDLSNFNTVNVTNMVKMFSSCISLTSLNLNSFNTANVTDMRYMFVVCSSLTTIYAKNWCTNTASLGVGMFVDCYNLVGGKGTKIGNNLYGYDELEIPLYYNCPADFRAAHIDGGKDNPGLFTAK